MSVKGDFQKLARLAGSLRRGIKRAPNDILKAFAADVTYLVDKGFLTSTSPYGEVWAPLKHRVGMPLLDTGVLRSSIKVTKRGTGIRVSSNLVYAATHNYGRGPIPKRQFLPDDARGLPPSWAALLRARADEVRQQLGLDL